jgi:hypothetical protein
MPLVQTRGAASAQGFGEFAQAAAIPIYIEDVFSTYLYTGTGATLAINNGIDLSGNGGLVWLKRRDGVGSNWLQNTVAGIGNALSSNSTAATGAQGFVTSVSTTGFTVDTALSASSNTYVSWTFREQPKFFDVVTWTGNGGLSQTLPHNLGSAPGLMLVKNTSIASNWRVYHRSLGATKYMVLNTTGAEATASSVWYDTEPTSSVFTIGNNNNNSGDGYVAYLFAHDAGGFGLLGTDNVISCGSFTADGSGGCSVTLGYEPQWVMYKNTANDGWRMGDVMRGWSQTQWRYLTPNDTSPEGNLDNNPSYLAPTSTGFNSPTPGLFTPGDTFVYIAIRRGPMKVPTVGTSVFAPVAQNASANAVVTTNFPVDLSISAQRSKIENGGTNVFDRLRGTSTTGGVQQQTNRDTTEYVQTTNAMGLANNTALIDNFYTLFGVTSSVAYWNFRRAPSFFDEVCYTGTGSATTQTHNLGVVPDLMIVKKRSATDSWAVYSKALGTSYGQSNYLLLNTDAGMVSDSTLFNSTAPTSSVFSVGTNGKTNTSAATYVAYLFATCVGVSKVGTYQGTGTTQTINCGFTAGSRFVLIKRTDDVGDWYVWDSARGIVAGNDPYLLLNDTAAEVTGTDYVDTANSGFEISSTAPAAININGGLFIFLAIA